MDKKKKRVIEQGPEAAEINNALEVQKAKRNIYLFITASRSMTRKHT
jgi:hypothetical protein